MRALELYDYAIVRVVPRVEREEFINAGAIVSCQRTGFLQAEIDLDGARLRALDPWADVALVQRHLQALVAICAGAPQAGPIAQLAHRARFHWLTARRSSIIQTSPVHTGWCDEPGVALARLMDCMVRPFLLRACPEQGSSEQDASGATP